MTKINKWKAWNIFFGLMLYAGGLSMLIVGKIQQPELWVITDKLLLGIVWTLIGSISLGIAFGIED